MANLERHGYGLFTVFLLGAIKGAVSIDPCPTTAQSFEVTTTAEARELATALNCSGGGSFDVRWEGTVIVDQPIVLTDGMMVTIAGVGTGAIVDGDGYTQLFTVSDSTLNLVDIALENGYGSGNGGAVWAGGVDSAVFCNGTTSFNNNEANTGGAVSIVDGALMSWSGDTSFTGNHAHPTNGGAVNVAGGATVSASGRTNFTGNVASIKSGAMYSDGGVIALDGETNFVDNRAQTRGGAILATAGSDVFLSGVTSFKNSTLLDARETGGTIEVEESVLRWQGETSFSGGNGGHGGALRASASNVSWAGETSFCDNKADLFGGALSILSSSDVSWTGETLFCNNRAAGYTGDGGIAGAIYVVDSSISWNGTTTFTNNSALSAGGALYGEGDTSMVWDGVTVFEENVASTNGGAIALIGDVSLDSGGVGSDLSLKRNVASIAGGAVYFSGITYGLHWTGVSFLSNSAVNGGAVYSVASGTAFDGGTYISPSTYTDCVFRDNTAAVSGGAVESAASRDNFVNNIFENNTAGEVGGGLSLAGTTDLTGCDFVGNGANAEGPAVVNVGTVTLANTLFTNNSLICAAGEFLNYNVEPDDTAERATENYYNSVCDGCEECTGDCLLDRNGTQECIAALEYTKSTGVDQYSGAPITLETLQIKAGYWRSVKKSAIILPCWNEDACIGGLTGAADYCDDGYRGPYCAVCEDGYSPTLAYTCSKCSNGEGIAFAAIVLLVVAAAVVVVIFHLVSNNRDETNTRFKRLTKALPVQGFKTVVVAWQILTQFDAVANVTYAGVYGEFLDGISSIISFDLGMVVSAGCVVTTDFHDRLLISTLGPLVALGALAVCFKVATRRNQGSNEALQIVRRKHFSMALLITFLVYTSVSSTVFRVFDCETLDGGKDYLRADYTIECTDAKHKASQVYGVFMILLYPIGIPLLYAMVLFKNREVVKDRRHRSEQRSVGLEVTASLWKPYKPSRYYYEVVECARRVTLTGVVVFIYPNTAAQVAVTLVLAFVFVMVSESLVPYASRQDIWMSRVGHIVVFLSMFQALVLKVDVSDENSDSQEVFGGVLLAANICMVIAVITEAVLVVCSLCGRGDGALKEKAEPGVRNTASKKTVVETWDVVEAEGRLAFTGIVPEPLS